MVIRENDVIPGFRLEKWSGICGSSANVRPEVRGAMDEQVAAANAVAVLV